MKLQLPSALLALAAVAGASATSNPRAPISDPILDPILNLLAAPPPTFLQACHPSPNCTKINGGELQCCRGTVAGDNQLVVFLAGLYGYKLNHNDINGLDCDDDLDSCPGVKVCCQVTALAPLLSLWCRDY